MDTSAPSSSRGKAAGSSVNNAGFRAQPNMTAVQPPKPEDLQMSYASVVGVDPQPKGWYGAMSMFLAFPPQFATAGC